MTETRRTGTVLDINGPIVTIRMPGIRNGQQVRIGHMGLYGEVIALKKQQAVVQAYESTEGIRPGEPVEDLGWPLSVELGPGLMGQIFDGVQRPLEKIFAQAGDHIPRGLSVPALQRDKLWRFVPSEDLESGDGAPPKRSTSPFVLRASGSPIPLAGIRTHSNSPLASESAATEPSGRNMASR